MIRLFIILLSTIVIISALWLFQPKQYNELEELSPVLVVIAQVKVADVQPVKLYMGKLQPAQRAAIHFELVGQVKQRAIEIGQKVEQDEVLITILADDFIDSENESSAHLAMENHAITRDQNMLSNMQKKHDLQAKEVKRLEQLGKQSLTSQSHYEQALQQLYQLETDISQLQYSVDSAQPRQAIAIAKLNKARRNLKRTELRAPFAGVVNAVYVELGDYVSINQAALELVNIDELDLRVQIQGVVARGLSIGQAINIRVGDINLIGRLIALSVDPDPKTNTHTVKIRLADDRLYAGQLATVELPVGLYNRAHLVPVGAVIHDDGKSYVFRYAEQQAKRVLVTILERYQEWYIVDGIQAEDYIIAQDVATLFDGQAVTIE